MLFPLLPPTMESRGLTPIPWNTLPLTWPRSLQPRGPYSKFSSSLVFKYNKNLLLEDNSWLRASTYFLCLIFTVWGISVLAEELTWCMSCSLTHCALWVPIAYSTGLVLLRQKEHVGPMLLKRSAGECRGQTQLLSLQSTESFAPAVVTQLRVGERCLEWEGLVCASSKPS